MPAATHRRSKTYLYRTWTNMKQRCTNPGHPLWRLYGGRGISVCERWLTSFEAFAADMGERPSQHFSLDRIDVNGPYEPGNCRWADDHTQMRNTRITRTVVIEGIRYIAADLAELSGRKQDTIIERAARGFSYAEVIGDARLSNLKGIRMAVAARSIKFRTATHCQNGHEFTEANTRFTKEGWKRCRTCARLKAAREREARRKKQQACEGAPA